MIRVRPMIRGYAISTLLAFLDRGVGWCYRLGRRGRVFRRLPGSARRLLLRHRPALGAVFFARAFRFSFPGPAPGYHRQGNSACVSRLVRLPHQPRFEAIYDLHTFGSPADWLAGAVVRLELHGA